MFFPCVVRWEINKIIGNVSRMEGVGVHVSRLAENDEAVGLKSRPVQQVSREDFSPCHMPNQVIYFAFVAYF